MKRSYFGSIHKKPLKEAEKPTRKISKTRESAYKVIRFLMTKGLNLGEARDGYYSLSKDRRILLLDKIEELEYGINGTDS